MPRLSPQRLTRAPADNSQFGERFRFVGAHNRAPRPTSDIADPYGRPVDARPAAATARHHP